MKLMEIKEARKNLEKALKRMDEAEVRVQIYECFEDVEEGDYTVEINLYEDGEYIDGWNLDEYLDVKEAKKRASAVKSTVKGWLKNKDEVTLKNEIAVYHV